MDNPNNRLITKSEVEDILNRFENIGDDGTRLEIASVKPFQTAFVHESYFQSVQNLIGQGDTNYSKNSNYYVNFVPDESSERLEYLGDHILKAVMGRYLFERFDTEREGFLTKLKIKIEKCSMLHKIGVELGFRKFLLLSLQVENQTILDIDRGRNTPSYNEDAFEAFIGALVVEYGIKGYIYADRFVRSIIENTIDFAELIAHNDNFKDSLQRFFQAQKWKTPVYTTLQEDGPLYRKVFTRMLVFTREHFFAMDASVQHKIQLFTDKTLQFYKTSDDVAFKTLFKIVGEGNYVLGIGYGKKVVSAEQDCARMSMLQLNLDLNY